MVAFGSFGTIKKYGSNGLPKKMGSPFHAKKTVFFLQQALKKQFRLGRNLKGFPLSQWGPYL